MRDKWLVAGICASAILIATGAIYVWSYRTDPILQRCDQAIQDKLRAPATFRRISYSGQMISGRGFYEITYDAENSFGVPLRSHGWCDVDWPHDKVTWNEMVGTAS